MKLEKILIVEDEKDIQMLTEIGLKDIGKFSVRIANDGREALEILKEWVPDLVLMDVMMPNLTGTETMKIMQADSELRKIPVFFLTAKSEDEAFDAYYAIGVKEVFIKPFDPLLIASEISEAFNKHME